MSVEAFKKARQRLIKELFSQQAYQEAKASGRFEAFVRSDESADISAERWTQYGTPYTPYIDVGRGKTVNKSGGLVSAIYDWLQYRKYDLNWSNDKERTSLAFAIARKMSKEGSFKRRNPDKRTAIVQTALEKTVPFMLAELGKDVTKFVESEVQAEIESINKSK